MAHANPDRAARETQWWKDWRAADYSWDGLAAKSPEACGDIGLKTLQDYWAAERDRLIVEPGTARRWTRFHCPLAFADGSPSPKASWGEAEWKALADDLAKLMLDPCVLFTGIVAPLPATPPGLWLNGQQAWIHGPLRLSAATYVLDQAWIAGAVIGGETDGLWARDAVLADGIRVTGQRLGPVNLNGALLIGYADFTRATFTDTSTFTGARFAADRADFSEATFSHHAQFEQTQFGGMVDFFGVQFLNRALFDGAQFLDYLGFYKTAFVRRLSINDARFYGKVNLEGVTDGDPIAQSPQGIRLWANGDGEPSGLTGTLDAAGGPSEQSFRSLPKLHARRAEFHETANFSNRDLLSPSTFREAQFYERAQFFGSDIHASVNFHGTGFRKALRYNPGHLPKYPEALLRLRYLGEGTGDYATWKKAYCRGRVERRGEDFTADSYFDSLETSFRTLKQMMEDRRDRVREGEFFNLELRARRKRTDVPWWERVASFIYWGISDYGNSIFRPLAVMLMLYVGLSLLYFAMGDHENLFSAGVRFVPSHLYSAFGFSWNNVFSPFSVLDPQRFSGGDPWAHDLVVSPDAGFDFRVKVIATMQSLLTLTLAFLAGLAGRRRFQIN